MEEDEKWQKVISAGLIIYRMTDQGPKFLLLYRGRNIWDLPRGRMEAAERSLQTAFREVWEETGLRRSDLRIERNFRKAYEKFPYTSGRRRVFKIVIFYLAETANSQVRVSPEHEGYAWFNLNEARRHLTRFKVRQAIIKKAWDFIKRPSTLPPPKYPESPKN